MTSTQAAYNAGVLAVLAVAETLAEGIEQQQLGNPRHLSAATALRCLAEGGRALLVAQPLPPEQDAAA